MENKQKLIIGAAVVGVLLFGVAIGNSSKNNTSAPSSQSQVTEPPAPTYSDEDYFLAEVRSSGNAYVANADDASLISIGKQTCGLLDDGYTVLEIATYLVENGTSNDSEFYEFEGIVMGAGIRNFCPEYSGQIS